MLWGNHASNVNAFLPNFNERPFLRICTDMNLMNETEARFQAVFENASVGMARVAPDGHFLEVNQWLCNLVGYSRDELMTKTFADLTHPHDIQADLHAMRRLLAAEIEMYVTDKRYVRKNGSVAWCNLTTSLLRKDDGSPDYFISVVQDISARKQAEEGRHEGEERLALASKAAGLGIFEWDVLSDRAVWENDRMYEIFGHTHADGTISRSKLLECYVHADDIASLSRVLEEGVKAGGPLHTIYRIRRKDGALRWLDLAGNVELAHDGVPTRMIAVLADITERHQAEENLRASEAQFRLLADTAPVMIWVSGTDKLCTFVNKSWLDFTGRPMEVELGNGWTEGIYAEDFDRCMRTLVSYFEVRKPYHMEYRLRRYDGEYRWVLGHGTPRFSPDGDFLGYVGSAFDITERVRAEAEREQLSKEQAARATAEAASRAKDEFLAMVSHELRSPLNAIFGYTRMLRDGKLNGENTDRIASVIERSAKAQLRIIEDLLDSARIVSGKLRIEPEPVDLVPVLESALDTLRPAAEAKGLTLAADFDLQHEEVLGDAIRLEQIVWNLLSNSIKFTPEGGRVELRMQHDADQIRVTVRDTGAGIDADFMPYIFERFLQSDVTSSRRFGGLGLGLSLVKYLVELHGGAVTAASEGRNRGTTFTVVLPRLQPVISTRA
jgi:PAS domain S-box-containing protein